MKGYKCNKAEATGAKDIALVKMRNKDFSGARRMLLNVECLRNDLDDLPQVLPVCDVLCAAKQKFGGEMDWYGVLQIQPTAFDKTITIQFRKYALLVHPDKNKFPGAEEAFRLIAEAYCVLSDKNKRSLHDPNRGFSSLLCRTTSHSNTKFPSNP